MTFNNTFLTKSLNVLGNRTFFFLNVGENRQREGKKEAKKEEITVLVQQSLKSTVQLVNGFVAFGGGGDSGWVTGRLSTKKTFSSLFDVLPQLHCRREKQADALPTALHPAVPTQQHRGPRPHKGSACYSGFVSRLFVWIRSSIKHYETQSVQIDISRAIFIRHN